MVERLALVGLVALGLVAVVLGLLEWLVLRGLRQVVHVAERVAAGDWTSRITQKPLLPDLALVGRSVNMMLDSLEASVNTDALTGLANRRALDRFLLMSLNRLKRHGVGFTVVMIDIDAFKPFNDHYGHGTGDDVLQMVGAAIQRFARRTDEIAARYGGEEFTLILAETDPEKLALHLEALRQAVEAIAIPHLHSPHAVCNRQRRLRGRRARRQPAGGDLARRRLPVSCQEQGAQPGSRGVPRDEQDFELFSSFMTQVA